MPLGRHDRGQRRLVGGVHAGVGVALLHPHRNAHEPHLRKGLERLRARHPDAVVEAVVERHRLQLHLHREDERLHEERNLVEVLLVRRVAEFARDFHGPHRLRHAVDGADELSTRHVEPERPDDEVPLRFARGDAQLAQANRPVLADGDRDRVTGRVAVVRLRARRQRMHGLALVHLRAGDAAAHPERFLAGIPRNRRHLAHGAVRHFALRLVAPDAGDDRQHRARPGEFHVHPDVAAPAHVRRVLDAEREPVAPERLEAEPCGESLVGGRVVGADAGVVLHARGPRLLQRLARPRIGKGARAQLVGHLGATCAARLRDPRAVADDLLLDLARPERIPDRGATAARGGRVTRRHRRGILRHREQHGEGDGGKHGRQPSKRAG